MPGVLNHPLPQAMRVQRMYSNEDLVVVGLHTVFKHHDVTAADAWRRSWLNSAIRSRSASTATTIWQIESPTTMHAYALQGTPSTVLIDRAGRIRSSSLGAIDDLTLGTTMTTSAPNPAATRW